MRASTWRCPGPARYYGEMLVRAIRNAQVEIEQLDDNVRRVLRTLFRTGVMDAVRRPAGELGSERHRGLAVDIARESITLLKNERWPLAAFARTRALDRCHRTECRCGHHPGRRQRQRHSVARPHRTRKSARAVGHARRVRAGRRQRARDTRRGQPPSQHDFGARGAGPAVRDLREREVRGQAGELGRRYLLQQAEPRRRADGVAGRSDFRALERLLLAAEVGHVRVQPDAGRQRGADDRRHAHHRRRRRRHARRRARSCFRFRCASCSSTCAPAAVIRSSWIT